MKHAVAICFWLLLATSAHAATVDWADWVSGTTTPGLVTGTVAGVNVTLTAPSVLPSQAGLPSEAIYWRNTPTYISTIVENAPTTPDIIKINAAQAYTVTFSTPVTDPVIAIVSLGGGPITTQWDFGAAPIQLVSQGPGAFGSGPLSVSGSILSGKEGHGVIQVLGTYTTLTWTSSIFENWSGFTVGIPQSAPVPTPNPTPEPVPTPTPTPTPTPLGRIVLEWNSAEPTLEAPINNFRIYRGIGQPCDQPTPLIEEVGSVLYPITTFTDMTVPLSVGRVCYEATAVNAVGESGRSNRAQAFIGTLLPGVPLHLRIAPGVPAP